MVGDADPPGSTGELWSDVTREFRTLGGRLRSFYDENGGDGTGEIRDALQDMTAAAQRLGQAVSDALGDPAVQEQAKHALTSLVAAMSATIDNVRTDIAVTEDST